MAKQINGNILRKDISSNKRLPRNELLRIVKNKNGQIFVDIAKNAHGRGVYIYPSELSIKKIKQKNLLDRSYRTHIESSIYDNVEKDLLKIINNE
ncbi:YlxR family protein [Spiroplasma turonicum]|uniref:Putative RNA-binding protein n=1 Tax=Spiroplasma turonicum TaxID=216946 RepID=A0A0K1P6R3_9MOLU|nr:YlxR family protein [Spiroplasma turonicum]AKU79567.1 putative RNA-binding protein [Spiroplasma turonicum]ALX70590.1 putative RNA-binding protein [Spiroplasma turonicum]